MGTSTESRTQRWRSADERWSGPWPSSCSRSRAVCWLDRRENGDPPCGDQQEEDKVGDDENAEGVIVAGEVVPGDGSTPRSKPAERNEY